MNANGGMMNANKVAERNRIIEIIEDAGYTPRSYSGRGMYGERCVAVTLPSPAHIADIPGVPRPKTDSLGLGIIAYWPGVPPPDGGDEEEEEEEEEG